ncbi:MAG: hypothetical protein V4622_09190 [Bacteroidota bacterium]
MNTILFLCAESTAYLVLLYFSYKLLNKVKGVKFLIFSIALFLIIWFITESFNQFHYFLRDRKIYIELGHASIKSLLLLAIAILLYFAMIAFLLIKKYLKK